MKVSLVNYVFEPLYIQCGESNTFELDKGMPAGYNDILVRVDYGMYGNLSVTHSIRKNFSKGSATVIKIVNNGTAAGIE